MGFVQAKAGGCRIGGLDCRGKIRRMSKGMKQKVAIVAAFMHDPAALVRQEDMAAFTAALHRHEVTDIAVRGQLGLGLGAGGAARRPRHPAVHPAGPPPLTAAPSRQPYGTSHQIRKG